MNLLGVEKLIILILPACTRYTMIYGFMQTRMPIWCCWSILLKKSRFFFINLLINLYLFQHILECYIFWVFCVFLPFVHVFKVCYFWNLHFHHIHVLQRHSIISISCHKFIKFGLSLPRILIKSRSLANNRTYFSNTMID